MRTSYEAAFDDAAQKAHIRTLQEQVQDLQKEVNRLQNKLNNWPTRFVTHALKMREEFKQIARG